MPLPDPFPECLYYAKHRRLSACGDSWPRPPRPVCSDAGAWESGGGEQRLIFARQAFCVQRIGGRSTKIRASWLAFGFQCIRIADQLRKKLYSLSDIGDTDAFVNPMETL